METDESPVASVDRALRILTVVGSASRGLSLDELAGRLDIPKSSLHRILAALRYRGFIAQPEPGGSYFLGTELLATAFRFYDVLDLRALIHPLLARLAGDVSTEADVNRITAAACEALGGLDVLINNAGTARRAAFLDITPGEIGRAHV